MFTRLMARLRNEQTKQIIRFDELDFVEWLKPFTKIIMGFDFSSNPHNEALKFLLEPENQDKINWCDFSQNSNPIAVQFLLQPENQDKIYWGAFSQNSNPIAVQFLLQPENQYKINWCAFSRNPNPCAVQFLLQPENHKYFILYIIFIT